MGKYKLIENSLENIYGTITWHPGQSAMDELVSCILSQNTNDNNRDRAFDSLKAKYPTWQDVVDAPTNDIIDTIRPAGLANTKGPRIQNILRFIKEEQGVYNIDFLKDIPLEEARKWLTDLDGVGPKTAAIVLCFAFNLPAFPVDTHIYRVSKRLGFYPEKTSVEKAHLIMESIVPPEKHYAFHIYLIRHGRDTCKARKPLCQQCVLTKYCNYYKANP